MKSNTVRTLTIPFVDHSVAIKLDKDDNLKDFILLSPEKDPVKREHMQKAAYRYLRLEGFCKSILQPR